MLRGSSWTQTFHLYVMDKTNHAFCSGMMAKICQKNHNPIIIKGSIPHQTQKACKAIMPMASFLA
ncbi:MAG: hypothetical protein DBW67_07940 [SAR116 cluster bacterium]|nr:MAG: hypothetical protein DBW67_07940 [SAR116 cluster bacterium]